MTSVDMETDETDLEDLITQAEAETELNPVEFIQVGKAEYMGELQRNLDGCYKDCLQKFGEWKRVFATVLDVSVETALQSKLTKFKQTCSVTRGWVWPNRRACLWLWFLNQPRRRGRRTWRTWSPRLRKR